ncbi:hypothetical protein [Anatilimnocola floriformis]|nr:hypothetical protein [Anatilimnocola floriformis]
MSHFTSSLSATIMLIAVWSVILGNLSYCVFKLLRSERKLSGDE